MRFKVAPYFVTVTFQFVTFTKFIYSYVCFIFFLVAIEIVLGNNKTRIDNDKITLYSLIIYS